MGLIRRIGRKILGRSGAPEPRPEPSVASGGEAFKESLSRIDCGAQELKERLGAGEEIVIVDVRSADERGDGSLPGAVHIPLPELEARWTELEGADEIVCYCTSGSDSVSAARLLRKKGLINATALEGGVAAWESAGGQLR
jgi:rhodanese-related sulfurtransferase